MTAVAESLERLDGVSRVRAVSATRPGHVLVAGLVRPNAIDPLMDELGRLGVPESGITLSRVEAVGQMVGGAAETTLVWADVLSAAWHHARPIGRYFALMLVAGVIASYGVIERNAILDRGRDGRQSGPPADHRDQRRGRGPKPAADRRGLRHARPRAGRDLPGRDGGGVLPGPARSAPLRLQPGRCGDRVGGPRDRQPRDDRRRPGCGNRRHAGARNSRQRGGGGGGVGDHDPGRRLSRRRDRNRRARVGPGRPGGTGHERVDDGRRSFRHPGGSAGSESPGRPAQAAPACRETGLNPRRSARRR